MVVNDIAVIAVVVVVENVVENVQKKCLVELQGAVFRTIAPVYTFEILD